MKKLFLLMLTIGAMQGCSTTLKLNPVASDEQNEIFQGGTKALISTKKSLVTIRPSANSYQSGQRPSLVVSVTNGTDASYNFSPDNIRASINGQSVKVFTYEELVAEVNSQQAWAILGAALGSAAQSFSAANSGYTYNTSYYSSGYGGNRYTPYSSYTYNSAAVQQAQAATNAQNQANMAAIKTQTDKALDRLSSTILRKETVFPQKTVGGYITLDKFPVPDSANEVTLNVSAGGEMHQFKFMLTVVDK
jgi:hypothetical protein